MKNPRWGVLALFAGATAIAAVPGGPGVLNYVEGESRLGANRLSAQSVGTAQLERGKVLETTKGRAEVLLSPGVFLRLGEYSSVRMLSPDLLDTRVQLMRGSALVEVAHLPKNSAVRVVDDGGAQTTLLKRGVYRFNADNDTVAVYDGKAKVMSDDRVIELKSGREVNLNGPLTEERFDKKKTQDADPLYTWSQARSHQLSEVTAQTARTYVVNGWGFPGSGWYWNPWSRMYGWMPGDPFFHSPFGPAYYSPFAFMGPRAFYGPTFMGPVYRTGPVMRPGIGGGGRAVGPPTRAGSPGRVSGGINPGLNRRR
jgi:hypothetical protein